MIILKRIRQTKANWIGLVKKIRSHFGDERLYLTFCPFKGEKLGQVSTFGRDNIDKLDGWLVLMQSRFFSRGIDAIVVAVRAYLPDKIDINDKELLGNWLENGWLSGRAVQQFETEGKITVPRKDLYRFLFTKDEIILFNENETYDAQITDAFTGEALKHEPGLVYRSSIELFEEVNKEDI